MAVQVDPIKPTLKAPGDNPLTLKYDEPLSTFAFKFNLRRYTVAVTNPDVFLPATNFAGAYGMALHSYTSELNLSHFYHRTSMKPPSVSHKSAHDKPKSGRV
jgi:hypothetical protein